MSFSKSYYALNLVTKYIKSYCQESHRDVYETKGKKIKKFYKPICPKKNDILTEMLKYSKKKTEKITERNYAKNIK